MSKIEYQTRILKGTLEYARVHTPRNKFGTNGDSLLEKEFSLNLLLDSPEAMASYEAIKKEFNIPDTIMGHPKVKTKEDGTPFVAVKSNAAFMRDGEIVPMSPEVVDCEGKAISKDVLIGNGSKANVAVKAYVNNRTGQGNFKLAGVQVTELVQFTPAPKESHLFSPTDGTPIATEIDVTLDDNSTGTDGDVF